MHVTLYVLLLMCISNAGECELSRHGEAYVVSGYYEDHITACYPVNSRDAYCFYSTDADAGWESFDGVVPDTSTEQLAVK